MPDYEMVVVLSREGELELITAGSWIYPTPAVLQDPRHMQL